MAWFLLSISAALFESTKDIFSKKALKAIDELILNWSMAFFTMLFFIPPLLITGLPQIQPPFWSALVIGGILNTLASVLYLQAIQRSDLSITVPIVNFTPLFLISTSPLIVHEHLTPFHFMGGLLIVLGSYVLNFKNKKQSLWAPLQAIWQEPGPKLMLGVALIWSITSNFDKVGIQNSSSLFWLVTMHGFIALALLPLMWRKTPKQFQQISLNLPALLPLGLLNSLIVLCQMSALTLTLVVHVIAVKRTSTLFSVVLGGLIFREKHLRQRLFGATIIVLGVICIALR